MKNLEGVDKNILIEVLSANKDFSDTSWWIWEGDTYELLNEVAEVEEVLSSALW